MKKLKLPAAVIFIYFFCTSFHSTQLYDSPYYIVINKAKYELNVFDSKGWLVTYPVVFGNSDLRDKLYAGDKKTPEGTFTITEKKVHAKWDRFMMLDYPTKESYEKFNERKNSAGKECLLITAKKGLPEAAKRLVNEDLLNSARALDKHYIPTRYPNGFAQGAPMDYYTKRDGEESIGYAKSILEFCRLQIR